MSSYTIPKYSKGAVRRAGKVLAGEKNPDIDVSEARRIASNWRSSHAYPTWVIRAYLTNKIPHLTSDYLIASRTKKMPTIESKLSEGIISDLSTMQDIGGCRVIVNTVEEANKVVDFLERGKTRTHSAKRKKDYFKTPKPSGYRGVHLISKYKSNKKTEYNGMQVETQVRTKLIHSWATTVEAVDLMSGSMLKRSQGDDEWKEFFTLVADNISRTEGTNRVTPEIPHTQVDKRIRTLSERLNVSNTLQGWESIESIKDQLGKNLGEFFIVVLKGQSATIHSFRSSDDAETAYSELEGNPELNAVSVSAKDMSTVRSVYPNYFLDCHDFRNYIESI